MGDRWWEGGLVTTSPPLIRTIANKIWINMTVVSQQQQPSAAARGFITFKQWSNDDGEGTYNNIIASSTFWSRICPAQTVSWALILMTVNMMGHNNIVILIYLLIQHIFMRPRDLSVSAVNRSRYCSARPEHRNSHNHNTGAINRHASDVWHACMGSKTNACMYWVCLAQWLIT